MKILEETVEDIKKIEYVVKREVSSGHGMLEKPSKELKYPLLLSLLLLVSAKFNQYCFDKLEPAAIGLELLGFGLQKHYQRSWSSRLQDCRIDSLSLIAGDYYYSKGILFASQLGKSFVVETMSQAIVEVTEAEVRLNEAGAYRYIKDDLFEKYGQSFSKQAALYRAACKLGALLGGVDDEVSRSLEKCGQLIGIIYRFCENIGLPTGLPDVYRKSIKDLVANAEENLAKLPANKYSFFLAELLQAVASPC